MNSQVISQMDREFIGGKKNQVSCNQIVKGLEYQLDVFNGNRLETTGGF